MDITYTKDIDLFEKLFYHKRMKLFKFFPFIFGFLFIIPLFRVSLAASLQFDPTTVKTQAGQTFEIKVNVEAGNDEIRSVDAYVLYDPNLLEVSSVIEGTFFNTVIYDLSQSGKVYIGGMVDDPATSRTGSGTLATIVFKAKSDGSADLTFDCTPGSGNDSNTITSDLNATDIIECDSNGRAVITIGSGSSSPGQSGPSPTPTNRGPASPRQLPKSGIVDHLVKYSVAGTILLLIGTVAKLIL